MQYSPCYLTSACGAHSSMRDSCLIPFERVTYSDLADSFCYARIVCGWTQILQTRRGDRDLHAFKIPFCVCQCYERISKVSWIQCQNIYPKYCQRLWCIASARASTASCLIKDKLCWRLLRIHLNAVTLIQHVNLSQASDVGAPARSCRHSHLTNPLRLVPYQFPKIRRCWPTWRHLAKNFNSLPMRTSNSAAELWEYGSNWVGWAFGRLGKFSHHSHARDSYSVSSAFLEESLPKHTNASHDAKPAQFLWQCKHLRDYIPSISGQSELWCKRRDFIAVLLPTVSLKDTAADNCCPEQQPPNWSVSTVPSDKGKDQVSTSIRSTLSPWLWYLTFCTLSGIVFEHGKPNLKEEHHSARSDLCTGWENRAIQCYCLLCGNLPWP